MGSQGQKSLNGFHIKASGKDDKNAHIFTQTSPPPHDFCLKVTNHQAAFIIQIRNFIAALNCIFFFFYIFLKAIGNNLTKDRDPTSLLQTHTDTHIGAINYVQ